MGTLCVCFVFKLSFFLWRCHLHKVKCIDLKRKVLLLAGLCVMGILSGVNGDSFIFWDLHQLCVG